MNLKGRNMKTLVVIDMQNDFIDGSLANPDAQKIVDNIARTVSEWIGSVIFTRDTHTENYSETEEGRHLPIPHCIKETFGWEINDKIYSAAINNKNARLKIVDKPTFGAGTLLYDAIMEGEKPCEVVFVGTCTDICVVSNVLILKSFLSETPISVIESLCAGLTKEKHAAAIEVMRSCQVKII